MKRLAQLFSFTALAAFAAGCVLADKNDARRNAAYTPKGDAIRPTALFVKGKKIEGGGYTAALKRFLPMKRIARLALYWLS